MEPGPGKPDGSEPEPLGTGTIWNRNRFEPEPILGSILDPRAFRIEKRGSARILGRKAWIRSHFGSKNVDPRAFWVEKHGSARINNDFFY